MTVQNPLNESDMGLLMQDGLDSRQTYVVLTQGGNHDVHVGLRFMISREDPRTINIGGKLRVAYPYTDEGEVSVPESTNSPEQVLRDFYPTSVVWNRAGERRLSQYFYVPVALGNADGERYMKNADDLMLASHFLDAVSKRLGVPMLGPKGLEGGRGKLRVLLNHLFGYAISQLSSDDTPEGATVGGHLGKMGTGYFSTDEGRDAAFELFSAGLMKPSLSVVSNPVEPETDGDAVTVVSEVVGDDTSDDVLVKAETPMPDQDEVTEV